MPALDPSLAVPPPPPEMGVRRETEERPEEVQRKGEAGSELLLSAWNIQKLFPLRGGVLSTHIGDVRAVDGVSLDIHRAETVGLVGESGCGKTTVGRLLLRLIEPTRGHTFYLDPETHPSPDVARRLETLYAELDRIAPVGSPDKYEALRKDPQARNLLKELDTLADQYSLYRKKPSEMRRLRGKMQIVFQDPFSSLSPRMLVRDIVSEPLAIHHVGSRRQRYTRVAELLASVGLNPEHVWRFPHEFSGGQRQRIGIARALALRPDFIVLDEPTSALDVSVQAQILNILLRLQREQHLSYLFISHHLSVVRAVSHRVVVMYLGKVVEKAPTEELFERPLHPYTQALLSAIPIPDPTVHRERIILSGDVPSPAAPPSGCRFHTRCPKVMPVCSKVEPRLQTYGGRADHFVACHLYTEVSMPGYGLISGTGPPTTEIPPSAVLGEPSTAAPPPGTMAAAPALFTPARDLTPLPPPPPPGPTDLPPPAPDVAPTFEDPSPTPSWPSNASPPAPSSGRAASPAPTAPPLPSAALTTAPPPTAPPLPSRPAGTGPSPGVRRGFASFSSSSVPPASGPTTPTSASPAPAAVWRGSPSPAPASAAAGPSSTEGTSETTPPTGSAPPLPSSAPPTWRSTSLSESSLQTPPPASNLSPRDPRRLTRSSSDGSS